MIAEVDLFGVFLRSGLVSAAIAALLHIVLRRVLGSTGFYAWVWHRNLADVAIYIILWGAVAAALPTIGEALS